MELISHHQPEEIRKGQKETPHVRPLLRILLAGIHLGWTRPAPPGRTESKWSTKDNLETNPITIKSVWEFSWFPLPYCSPPRGTFPDKISCFVSTCVSLDNSFLTVRQEPFGPWKGPPFLQPGRGSLPDIAGTLISDLQPPELWKKILLFISHTVYGTLL